MSILTTRGKTYMAEIIAGTYSTSLKGAEKLALYGSIGGGADQILDTEQAITWVTGSPDSVYSTTDYTFTIDTSSGDVIVKGFVIFTDDISVTHTLDTNNIIKETFSPSETFTEDGTYTVEDLSFSFTSIGNLTTSGKIAMYKCLGGDYSATGYNGFDKVAIYGSVDGAADGLIGSVKSVTWGTPNVTVAFSADEDFPVASANTRIKGVLLFETADGVTYGEELSSETFGTSYLYELAGTFRIGSLTYGFE